MGYRQLDFAEVCQISGTSLKKYMKDQLPFSVELLKNSLNCSTALPTICSDKQKRPKRKYKL